MINIDLPLITVYGFDYVKMRGVPHHRLFHKETNALIDFWSNGTIYYPVKNKKSRADDLESILIQAKNWVYDM